MAIELGNAFEIDLVTLAGLDPATVDPTSVSIDFINPSGPTTVRVTTVTSVDTPALLQLVQKYTTPSTNNEPAT